MKQVPVVSPISNLKLCPICQTITEIGEKFCGKCGQLLIVDNPVSNKISFKSVLPSPTAIICTNCGLQLEENESFCGSCGQVAPAKTPKNLPVMLADTKFCPTCKAKLDADEKFCGVCGLNLNVPISKTPVYEEIKEKPKTSDLPWQFAIIATITLFILGSIAYLAFTYIFAPSPPSISSSSPQPSPSVTSTTKPSTSKPALINDQVFSGFKGSVYSVAFSPNGKMLAAGSSQNATETTEYTSELRIYDLETSQVKQQVIEHGEGIISLAFSPNGSWIAVATGLGTSVGGRSGRVKLFDVQTGQVIWAVLAHSDFVTSVAFSPDGATIASGSWDNTIKLWSITSGQLLQTIFVGAGVNTVAYSPDGMMLASGNQKMTVELWNVATGVMLWSFPSPNSGVGVKTVAFSPDGRSLATGSWSRTNDNQVNLWDIQTGSLIRSFRDQGYSIHSIAFSPDGQTLASGSWEDKNVQLWNLNNGSLIRRFIGHNNGLQTVAFSPDGKFLASGSADQTVRLWNVKAQ